MAPPVRFASWGLSVAIAIVVVLRSLPYATASCSGGVTAVTIGQPFTDGSDEAAAYATSSNCTWVAETSIDQVLTVYINRLALDNSTDDQLDILASSWVDKSKSVRLIAGADLTDAGGALPQSILPVEVETRSHITVINFVSDAITSYGTGFELVVTAAPKPVPNCGANITAGTTITDGSASSSAYGTDMYCVWRVTASASDATIQFTISRIDLDMSATHELKIVSGTTENGGNTLFKTDGQQIADEGSENLIDLEVEGEGSDALVIFRSGSSQHSATGFEIATSEVAAPEEDIGPPDCNVQVLAGDPVQHPGQHADSSSKFCLFQIGASMDDVQIKLKFSNLSLAHSSDLRLIIYKDEQSPENIEREVTGVDDYSSWVGVDIVVNSSSVLLALKAFDTGLVGSSTFTLATEAITESGGSAGGQTCYSSYTAGATIADGSAPTEPYPPNQRCDFAISVANITTSFNFVHLEITTLSLANSPDDSISVYNQFIQEEENLVVRIRGDEIAAGSAFNPNITVASRTALIAFSAGSNTEGATGFEIVTSEVPESEVNSSPDPDASPEPASSSDPPPPEPSMEPPPPPPDGEPSPAPSASPSTESDGDGSLNLDIACPGTDDELPVTGDSCAVPQDLASIDEIAAIVNDITILSNQFKRRLNELGEPLDSLYTFAQSDGRRLEETSSYAQTLCDGASSLCTTATGSAADNELVRLVNRMAVLLNQNLAKIDHLITISRSLYS